MFRYTKARAKPPRNPRSVHSGHQSQASLPPSAKPAASYKPGLKTQAHLATQLSATSRRATPGRLPLPEVLLLLLCCCCCCAAAAAAAACCTACALFCMISLGCAALALPTVLPKLFYLYCLTLLAVLSNRFLLCWQDTSCCAGQTPDFGRVYFLSLSRCFLHCSATSFPQLTLLKYCNK